MPIDQQRYDWIMQQIAAEREAARRKAGIPMPESEMPYVGEAGSGGPLRGGVPPAPVEPVEREQAVWGGPVQAGTGALLNPGTANFDVPQGDVNLYEPQSAPPPVGMGGGGKSAGGGASSGFELPEDRPAQAPARRKPGQPVRSVSVPTPEQDAKVVAESDADKWLADLDSMYGQIRGTEFDVNRWMKKLSVGAKIATGLSLAALAVSDAMAERRGEQPRNSVQKTIKQLIDMDVSEQRENYERKLGDFKAATNLYGIFRQKGLDSVAATQATKAYELQETKLNQDAEKFKWQMRVDRVKERQEDLRLQIMKKQAEMGGKQDARAEEMRLGREQRAADKLNTKINATQSALTALDDIEKAWTAYRSGKINAERFQQITESRRVPLSRGLGEVGNLAQEEQKAVLGGVPKVVNLRRPEGFNPFTWLQNDDTEGGMEKIRGIRKLFVNMAKNAIRSSPSEEAQARASGVIEEITGGMEDIPFSED